jgi:hypothetical protein
MLKRKYWHKSLTDNMIASAVECQITSLSDPGFCLICGCEAGGVEPDARNYPCEACGAEQVFGAEELMMIIA